MPQIINSNIASLNAQRNLNKSQGALNSALQRLSSGLRINSAKDDAAGLAISMRMSATISSLNQAGRNANDGISMIQTGESGMQEIQNMLIRMKELATQGSSDSIGTTERSFLENEITQLRDEIDNIAARTEFNGLKLLDGSVGIADAGTGTVTTGAVLGNYTVTNINLSGAKANETYTFANTAGVLTLTDSLGNAQAIDLSGGAAVAAGSTYTLNFNTLGVKVSLLATAADTTDQIAADLAAGTLDTGAGSNITIQVGSQSGAANKVDLSFSDLRVSTGSNFTALQTSITSLDGTRATYVDLLDQIETALDTVSSQRANLGAQQNRLEYTLSTIASTTENLSASRSRIQDADFAAETASLTRAQILQQAGVAMLAQANALPQNVLALVRG